MNLSLRFWMRRQLLPKSEKAIHLGLLSPSNREWSKVHYQLFSESYLRIRRIVPHPAIIYLMVRSSSASFNSTFFHEMRVIRPITGSRLPRMTARKSQMEP